MITLRLTPTEINIPLLRKAVEWVESQVQLPRRSASREWMQDAWCSTGAVRRESYGHDADCGTAYCVAGWIIAQEYPDAQFRSDSVYLPEENRLVSIPGLANSLLGIPHRHFLFEGSNTSEDIRRIAEALAGEKL